MNDADALVTDRSGIRRLAFVGLAGGLIGVGISTLSPLDPAPAPPPELFAADEIIVAHII